MTTTNIANPTFLSTFRGEFFKWRRHRFYTVIVVAPLILTVVIMALFWIPRLAGDIPGNVPQRGFSSFQPYDLGREGTFVLASELVFQQLASTFYPLIVILACIWHVANEYSWKTIKMLATRQPSRTSIVLTKCLFALVVVVAIFLSFVISWLVMGWFFKVYYNQPLTVTASDVEGIDKGLRYFVMWCLGNFIWGLFALTMAFRSRSMLGALVSYMILSNGDNIASSIGASFIYNGIETAPGISGLLIQVTRQIHPYLLTSNMNRISMIPNPRVDSSITVEWAWMIIALYIVAFIALGVWSFRTRDITD
jgi:ABC-type transport system involved in multi-copper enzyme maturation permease subunit